MRELKIKLYSFDELSEEAQEKAIESVRERMQHWDYSDEINEWYKQELDALGLPTDDIEFRLAYCQGDGMAFYGSIDLTTLLAKKPDLLADLPLLQECLRRSLNTTVYGNDFPVYAGLSRNSFGSHYSHWNTMYLNVEWDEWRGEDGEIDEEGKQLERECEELEGRLDTFVRDKSRELERDGYRMIEQRESDEACKDYALNYMDEEFTVDGHIY